MGYTGDTTVNQLEQITMEMPEVTVYFAGDHYVQEKDIRISCNQEKLELVSLSRAADTNDCIHYYIDLDISASVSHEGFSNICSAMQAFGKSIRANDRITLITFGDEVEEVLSMSGEEIHAGDSFDRVLGELANHDQTTMFYEALKWTAGKMNAERERDVRSVLCVITDGKNDDNGKVSVTQEEVQNILMQEGIPLYTLTIGEAAKESEGSLQELTRSSGGSIVALTPGTEGDGLRKLQIHLLRSYKARLRSDSNLISNELEMVMFENERTNERQQRTVLQNKWIEETQAPVVSEVERCADNQLSVSFSEAVQGSNSAACYRLTSQETGEQSIPAYASASNDQKSVVLTFPATVKGGNYSLSIRDITDISMEQNELTQAADILIPPAPSETMEKQARVREELRESAQAFFYKTWEYIGEKTSEFMKGMAEEGETETYGPIIMQTIHQDRTARWKSFAQKKAPVIGISALLLAVIAALLARNSLQKKRKRKSLEKMIISFGSGKEELQIMLKGTMIVGNARECDICISDSKMAAQHFALGLDKGQPVITNLSRTLPTLLNGRRLVSGEYRLRSGDVVEAGNMKMRLMWA